MKKSGNKKEMEFAVAHAAAIKGGNMRLANDIAKRGKKEGVKIIPPKNK